MIKKERTTHYVPSLPEDTPYFVAYRVVSNSRISENIAVGDLVFTPIGVFFVAGHFTLIPGDVPAGVKGPFFVDVQIAKNVISQSKWQSFYDSLHSGTNKFRQDYTGTTPDVIAKYPGVDVRFFPATEHDKARIEENWLTLVSGDCTEQFWITDEKTNAQAVRDYLSDPNTVSHHTDASDPLGFYAKLPGPMEVVVSLAQGQFPPQFEDLREAPPEHIAAFWRLLRSAPRSWAEPAISHAASLSADYKNAFTSQMASSKRRSIVAVWLGILFSTVSFLGAIGWWVYMVNDLRAFAEKFAAEHGYQPSTEINVPDLMIIVIPCAVVFLAGIISAVVGWFKLKKYRGYIHRVSMSHH